MSRKSSIDLYRFVLMIGIIVLHIIAAPERWSETRHLAYLLYACVDGFVLISGYFGVRFSIRKIVNLYATAIWCFALVSGISCIAHNLSVADFPSIFINVFKSMWFLHAYVLMMCLTPIINPLFETETLRISLIKVAPFLCAVFVWGCGCGALFLHHYLPAEPGLVPKSGLTLAGVYVVGRFYRLAEPQIERIPTILVCLGMLVCAVLCTVGQGWFGAYNSPFAVLLALGAFHLVKKVYLPRFVERFLWWFTPSVFAVYLLHANTFVYGLLNDTMIVKNGWYLGAATMCFFTCLLIDLPRRCLVWGLQRVIGRGGRK